MSKPSLIALLLIAVVKSWRRILLLPAAVLLLASGLSPLAAFGYEDYQRPTPYNRPNEGGYTGYTQHPRYNPTRGRPSPGGYYPDPRYDQARVNFTYELPSQEYPTYELPSQEIPTYELPSQEQPTYELPSQELPTYELPSQENPTYELPSQELPTYELPSQEAPPAQLPEQEIPQEGPQGQGPLAPANPIIVDANMPENAPGTDSKAPSDEVSAIESDFVAAAEAGGCSLSVGNAAATSVHWNLFGALMLVTSLFRLKR